MGETLQLPRAEFNRSIRIEARKDRLTSDAGALPIREALERLGLLDWMTTRLDDPRDPEKVIHPLRELLATSLLLISQGWRDQDDADKLRDDPSFRVAVSERRGVAPLTEKSGDSASEEVPEPKGLASQPTLSRLVKMLSSDANRQVLREALVVCAGRRIRGMRGHRYHRVMLDVDSLPIEVAGHQEGSEYNGHYHERIYHPLVASLGETGDLIDLQLRPGKVHTASGALEFVEPLVERLEREVSVVVAVRIDAGFPDEEFCNGLERRGTHYVARIRNNAVLDRMAQPYLDRHTGILDENFVSEVLGFKDPKEPRTWVYEESYRAGSWSKERRVVLVVQERPGELYPHHFWLLTSWTPQEITAETLLKTYRGRGCAEGLMGELMDVLEPALSSANRSKSHYRGEEPKIRTDPRDTFAANEVLLLLNALAYNMVHVIRSLLEAGTKEGWSLKRVREQVLKVAARFLVHSRYITVVIARSAAFFWDIMWRQIRKLRGPWSLPGFV